jgi:hypothetical protein
MSKEAALTKIENAIKRLTPYEQLRLMEKLTQHLQELNIVDKKVLNWNKLYGLGKSLPSEDAQEYVNRLREER